MKQEKGEAMKETLNFPINTPVAVTLQFGTGKRVEGQYGEQVMYSLLDNRVMYVPPHVEQRLQDLAIGAGEPVLLCKQRVNHGTRTRTEWSVKRAPQLPNGVLVSDSLRPAPLLDLQPVRRSQEIDVGARNGDIRPNEYGSGALAPEVMRDANQQQQPSGNSTAPMARESALDTNHQHQRQDSAGGEVALACAHPVALSQRDRAFRGCDRCYDEALEIMDKEAAALLKAAPDNCGGDRKTVQSDCLASNQTAVSCEGKVA